MRVVCPNGEPHAQILICIDESLNIGDCTYDCQGEHASAAMSAQALPSPISCELFGCLQTALVTFACCIQMRALMIYFSYRRCLHGVLFHYICKLLTYNETVSAGR